MSDQPRGIALEAELTPEQLQINATTWRHIWNVQRFLQQAVIAVAQGTKPTFSLLHLLNVCIIQEGKALTDMHDRVSRACPQAKRIINNTLTYFEEVLAENTAEQRKAFAIRNLTDRMIRHDQSKLINPEVGVFAEFTPLLAKTQFGSEEYKQFLVDMAPALKHHYRLNAHHPECHDDGVMGMNLFDVIEMLCDWAASSMRNLNGSIEGSIQHCCPRFEISELLSDMLLVTFNIHFRATHEQDPLVAAFGMYPRLGIEKEPEQAEDLTYAIPSK